jgi:hypothetical protein
MIKTKLKQMNYKMIIMLKYLAKKVIMKPYYHKIKIVKAWLKFLNMMNCRVNLIIMMISR